MTSPIFEPETPARRLIGCSAGGATCSTTFARCAAASPSFLTYANAVRARLT
jgi:hypothetical protein